jgi:hypothetical protein
MRSYNSKTDAKAELGSGARSAVSETSREAPSPQERSLRSGNGLEGAANTHTYHNAACDAGAWPSAGLAVEEARSKLPIPALSKILTASNLLANASRRFIPSRNRSEGAMRTYCSNTIGMSARSTKSINPLNSTSSFP